MSDSATAASAMPNVRLFTRMCTVSDFVILTMVTA